MTYCTCSRSVASDVGLVEKLGNVVVVETGKLESPSTAMAHGGDGGACVAGMRRSGTFWRSRRYEAGFGGSRIPDGRDSLSR